MNIMGIKSKTKKNLVIFLDNVQKYDDRETEVKLSLDTKKAQILYRTF